MEYLHTFVAIWHMTYQPYTLFTALCVGIRSYEKAVCMQQRLRILLFIIAFICCGCCCCCCWCGVVVVIVVAIGIACASSCYSVVLTYLLTFI